MKKTIDLFLFMGQSNMAGRGITNEIWSEPAPDLIPGAGWEFRAVTNPTRLYPVEEPFGVNENRKDGINDGNMKTGSMVTAFANAYYQRNGNIPLVGISASKGGSCISQWQPDAETGYLNDTLDRYQSGIRFLQEHQYEIRHRYMLWCQGETDGDLGTAKEDYMQMFQTMLMQMKQSGIEKCFMIQIGRYNVEGSFELYDAMLEWQKELAAKEKDVILVSESLKDMRQRGLMKDAFHYYQQAYNEVGTEAGKNAASYVNQVEGGACTLE